MPKKIKKEDILRRMSYLVGHLKGVVKMIEEDKYCVDIIRQNQAVIAALEKVNEFILRNHLETCVTEVVKGKSEKDKKRIFDEIIEVFNEK